MTILLFKGQTFISTLIKWQSRGVYSHAAIQFGDFVYEAREGKGVQTLLEIPPNYGEFDTFSVVATRFNPELVLAFLMKQVGKSYDYGSVLRFVTRRQENRTDSGKWFCSELVFAAVQKGGVNLLERIEPWAVSPSLLANSPLLAKQ